MCEPACFWFKIVHLLVCVSYVFSSAAAAAVLDIIEDYCTIRGHDKCRIDGSTSYADREEAIDGFNAPGVFSCLLSAYLGRYGFVSRGVNACSGTLKDIAACACFEFVQLLLLLLFI